MNPRDGGPAGPVAVEDGADGTRLVVPGPDGRPEPVAVLPPGTGAAQAVDALVGTRPVAVLAVVHPASRDPARDMAALAGRATRVRAVPVPLAVLGAGETEGPRLVVDAGRTGTDVAVVAGGRVADAVRVRVGGDRLDALLARETGLPVAEARAAREALSFRDAVPGPGVPHGGTAGVASLTAERVDGLLHAPLAVLADRVGELAGRAGPVEVVLTGGLARTPLLAALLDDRLTCPVRILPEPDRAAVRGALALVTDDADAADPAEPIDPGGPADPADRAGIVHDRERSGRFGRAAPARAATVRRSGREVPARTHGTG